MRPHRTCQRMSRRAMVKLLSVLFMIASGVGWAAPSEAQPPPAGVVVSLQGTSSVTRAASPGPSPLKFRDDIFPQDRVATGDHSLVRLLLGGRAVVTVHEQSTLTVTEVLNASAIEMLGVSRAAVVVMKERMKAGEVLEIRTPNAVAGVRGTVVVAEVSRTAGVRSADFTSTFTVLRGTIEVSQLDPLTRQPVGPRVTVGVLESVRVAGAGLQPARSVTPAEATRIADDYKAGVRQPPPGPSADVVRSEVERAVEQVEKGNGAGGGGYGGYGFNGASADSFGAGSYGGGGRGVFGSLLSGDYYRGRGGYGYRGTGGGHGGGGGYGGGGGGRGY